MALGGVRARYELRNLRQWIGVVCLLAIAGGAAITAAEAARRTDTAFSRALEAGAASDAVVNADTTGHDFASTMALQRVGHKLLDDVDRSPLVTAHGRFGGGYLFRRLPDGSYDKRFSTNSAFALVAFDDDIGRTIGRLRIHSGRPADPKRADEVTITPSTAKLTGWRVGSRVTDLVAVPADFGLFDEESGSPKPDVGTKLSVVVTGIADLPEELLHVGSQRDPRVFLTPAYAARFSSTVYFLNEWVRLRGGGADLAALRETVSGIQAAAPKRDGDEVTMPVSPTVDLLRKVNRANDPLVNGLWILAGLALLVGLLLAAQSLGRTFLTRAGDHAQLRALGATRGQRFGMELATLVAVALVGATLAALVGLLASPLTPIGTARDAEPHPGFSFDLALVFGLAAVLFAGTVLVALISVTRVATMRAIPGPVAIGGRDRPSRTADFAARSGLGAPAVVGVRLAMQPGRGATATPVRSALASLALVVAAVTVTFSFGVNLQRFTSTPSLYGWTWDMSVGSNFGVVPKEFVKPLVEYENVDQAGAMTLGQVTVAGQMIPAIGITSLRGPFTVPLDEGRMPATKTEVAFGARTLRALHAHVGDVVDATVSGRATRLTVVGRPTFAAFGNERGGETSLGTGALATASLFRAVDNSAQGDYNYVLLRFKRGTANATETKLRAFLAERGCADQTCIFTDSRPVEIDGYRSARGLPLVVGVVLALLLIATLLHVLFSTMRRRTGDLAILRALGFVPRQLVGTLRWQALALSGAALLIGIPCGLLASRVLWSAFTSALGVAPGMVWPIAAIAIGSGAMLALAFVLATVVAARLPRRVREYQPAQ